MLSHHARPCPCPFRAQGVATVSFAALSCSTPDSSYGIHRSATMHCLPSLPHGLVRRPSHVSFPFPSSLQRPHPGHNPVAILQQPSPRHQTISQVPLTRPTPPPTPSSLPSSLDPPQRPHLSIPSHTCAQDSSSPEGELIGVVFGRRGRLVRRVQRKAGRARGRWISGGGCRRQWTR